MAGTQHVRAAGTSAAARPFPPGPRGACGCPRPAAPGRHRHRHRRRGPAGNLAVHQSRLPQFYLLTMGLAGTWAAGALSSGPLPLNMTQGREDARRHPVVMSVLSGAAAFGLFYGAARLARNIPRSTGPSAASCATQTTARHPSCCSPRAPTRWPRNCFRGALWSLVQDAHPLVKTTLAYAATTAATRNPALMLAGTATSVLIGLQRRTSGRHPGPGAHPPHLVAPQAVLSPAPIPDAPAGRDHPGLTARAAWQMAADSAPAPHRTRRSARGSPWIMLSFQPLRFGGRERFFSGQRGSSSAGRDMA